MTEQLYENIYRIGVPLAGNPLRELNSYFIRGDEFDLLIDTGFRTPACEAALAEGLKELGSEKARRSVLLTHLHSDHSGLAEAFAGPDRPIYMGETELNYVSYLYRDETLRSIRNGRYRAEGFPEELMKAAFDNNPAATQGLRRITPQFIALPDGGTLTVGGCTLECVTVPGHSPGNCMLYVAEKQLMFTGDHVLFDITPNITWWPNVEDSLGNYLASLERAKGYAVADALPGHRKSGNYAERIDALLAHHARRLSEAAELVAENPGMTAYEIAGLMRWRIHAGSWEDFPPAQKWFAVGECISHLDYLRKRGILARTGENGVFRYDPL